MGGLRVPPGQAIKAGLLAALGDLGVTVYGVRPQGAAGEDYPHIHVETALLGEFDTNTEFGHEVTQRIHVRDAGDSDLAVQQIQAAIYDRLHNGALSLTGWRLILMQQETSFIDRLPDRVFDGISEFRLLIEQT